MNDMELFSYIITGVIAYLLGSINTAIIISALSGKDIRKEGSGNAGATNTLRVMGKKAAAPVALFDALKGVFAVIIARVVSSIQRQELPTASLRIFIPSSGRNLLSISAIICRRRF